MTPAPLHLFILSGALPHRTNDTIIYSCVKKSGKTTLNGALTLWWAFTQEAPNEILGQRRVQRRV